MTVNTTAGGLGTNRSSPIVLINTTRQTSKGLILASLTEILQPHLVHASTTRLPMDILYLMGMVCPFLNMKTKRDSVETFRFRSEMRLLMAIPTYSEALTHRRTRLHTSVVLEKIDV